MKLLYKIFFYVFGERIIFSYSSQPLPNNQHLNAYQYIHIRASFFTSAKGARSSGWTKLWLGQGWRHAKLTMQQIHM